MSRRRPAAAEDLPALVSLDTETFGDDAWSAASWAAELAQVPTSRHVELVEGEDGEVLAYVVVMVVADVADLQRIAVHPSARRTGLGGDLLAAAIERAASRGCERMLLEVADANTAALALYHRAGFEALHRRPDYYGAGRDALVLQRRL